MHEAGRVKNHRSRSKSMLFLIWKELQRFQVKESMFILKKKANFNKNEMKSKMENPTHAFRLMNLVFQFI